MSRALFAVKVFDNINDAMDYADKLQAEYSRNEMAGNMVKINGRYHVGVGKFNVKTPTLDDKDRDAMRRRWIER